jgi:hypothetical protein
LHVDLSTVRGALHAFAPMIVLSIHMVACVCMCARSQATTFNLHKLGARTVVVNLEIHVAGLVNCTTLAQATLYKHVAGEATVNHAGSLCSSRWCGKHSCA